MYMRNTILISFDRFPWEENRITITMIGMEQVNELSRTIDR